MLPANKAVLPPSTFIDGANAARLLCTIYSVHMGDAPIKVQQLSGCEIGVSDNLLDNQESLTRKLNGFELGA